MVNRGIVADSGMGENALEIRHGLPVVQGTTLAREKGDDLSVEEFAWVVAKLESFETIRYQ